jgi:hypothetical protein
MSSSAEFEYFSTKRPQMMRIAASPPVNMVWQLDYNSDETLAEPEIQLRPCGPTRPLGQEHHQSRPL